MADDDRPIIIIKKVKKVSGGGHHGGAWKVAYADFVTAMMAFFLLMWLLSNTTEEQRKGISDYFSPESVSSSTSGSGGVMGGMSLSSEKHLRNDELPPASMAPSKDFGGAGQDAPSEAERESLEQLREEIEEQIRNDPALAELAQNLIIEMTPEGLRIQIVDQDGKPMFASGSARPLNAMRRILAVVGETIRKVNNRLSITGHTDATPFQRADGYSNWELSTDRANASRRLMTSVGVQAKRVAKVEGKAAQELLNTDDPAAAVNRRISITLLYNRDGTTGREAPTAPIKNGVFESSF